MISEISGMIFFCVQLFIHDKENFTLPFRMFLTFCIIETCNYNFTKVSFNQSLYSFYHCHVLETSFCILSSKEIKAIFCCFHAVYHSLKKNFHAVSILFAC
jgi:hypothetical protein